MLRVSEAGVDIRHARIEVLWDADLGALSFAVNGGVWTRAFSGIPRGHVISPCVIGYTGDQDTFTISPFIRWSQGASGAAEADDDAMNDVDARVAMDDVDARVAPLPSARNLAGLSHLDSVVCRHYGDASRPSLKLPGIDLGFTSAEAAAALRLPLELVRGVIGRLVAADHVYRLHDEDHLLATGYWH